MRRDGFTLTDLIVGLLTLPFVGIACLAGVAIVDDRENRIRCASNLRMIGQAMLIYSNDARGPYPRTEYNAATADKPVWGTPYSNDEQLGPHEDANPFARKNSPVVHLRPAPNDVTGALYLTMRTQDITSNAFVCPATLKQRWDFGGGANTALSWTNWAGDTGIREHLSYSYQNPYPTQEAAMNGFRFNNTTPAEFATAADINPGTDALLELNMRSAADQMRRGNSPNHGRAGQNVLFGDGHVEFATTPFVGAKRDNIYTFGDSGVDHPDRGGDGIVGSPAGALDSILLPPARAVGLSDENGDMIETIPVQPFTAEQSREVRDLIAGTYVREERGQRMQLDITHDTLAVSSGAGSVSYTYELEGAVGDRVRLSLSGRGAENQPANISVGKRWLTVDGNGQISGLWHRIQ